MYNGLKNGHLTTLFMSHFFSGLTYTASFELVVCVCVHFGAFKCCLLLFFCVQYFCIGKKNPEKSFVYQVINCCGI